MAIDGTKFILRIPGYQQREDFAPFCAKAVEGFLAKKPPIGDANEMLEHLSGAIHDFREGELVRTKVLGTPEFGKPVDRSKHFVQTKLRQRYEKIAALILQRLFPEKEDRKRDLHFQFAYVPDGENLPINLCRFRRINGEVILDNPGDEANSKRLWGAIRNAFAEAIDEGKSRAYRRNKALEFYCLFSHYKPFEAGSAMAAHLALEYLNVRNGGLQTPHLRENVDLNLAACSRTPDQFIEAVNRSRFFDIDAKPDEMLEWQRAEIVRQANEPPYQEFHHADDVVRTAVELDHGRHPTTHRKMLMRRMLDAPEGAGPRIEVEEDEDGVHQVRVVGYAHDYLGLDAMKVKDVDPLKRGEGHMFVAGEGKDAGGWVKK